MPNTSAPARHFDAGLAASNLAEWGKNIFRGRWLCVGHLSRCGMTAMTAASGQFLHVNFGMFVQYPGVGRFRPWGSWLIHRSMGYVQTWKVPGCSSGFRTQYTNKRDFYKCAPRMSVYAQSGMSAFTVGVPPKSLTPLCGPGFTYGTPQLCQS